MKNEMKYLEIDGKKYPMMFDLNVMEDLQDKYGSIDAWSEKIEPKDGSEPSIKAIIFTFEHAINEGIDYMNDTNGTNERLLTSKQVGRLITEIGFQEAGEKIKEIVVDSTKSDEEKNS